MYRQVFVGREIELNQLKTAFDNAISGDGSLSMVVGEPGIGKTSLCEQLATYVTMRGGLTLVGHCYEEGSLSLPYLAFVEAMRTYVLDRDIIDLRNELGSGASEVARIVSEVRDKLQIEPRPATDPDEDRYRLFQAISEFLSNAANIQPLLIMLEDLHDSDKGTLDLLTHITRRMDKHRLLIVGTYRDVEVDRTHPLTNALAELLLRRLSGSNLCTTGIFDPTCVPRHLGGAAALLGRSDEARKYYQEAIKVTTEMPFRPELALTRLQLTELLLEHYPEERAEALEHLDFAISELHEMKMKPSLEKAQALKERF